VVSPPEAIARTIFFKLFPLVFVLRRLKNASSFLFLDDDVVAVVGIIIIILVDIIIILVVIKVFFPLNPKLCVCLCVVKRVKISEQNSAEFFPLSLVLDSISLLSTQTTTQEKGYHLTIVIII